MRREEESLVADSSPSKLGTSWMTDRDTRRDADGRASLFTRTVMGGGEIVREANSASLRMTEGSELSAWFPLRVWR